MIDKPLYGNPLAGGLPLTLESAGPPATGGTFNGMPLSNANFNVSAVASFDPGSLQPLTYEQAMGMSANKMKKSPAMLKAIDEAIKKGPAKLDPQANMPDVLGPQIIDNFKPKSDDPLMQGYLDSEFYSNQMTMDMVPYTFQGKDMMGSSSGASNLKKYLESIGKGDLLQFKNNDLMSQVGLAQVDTPEQLIESGQFTPGVGQDVTGNNPMETPIPSNPYNRVGQQLMGPNQDEMLGTLKNIEQGIASLVGNYGQDFNSNKSSNYGDFSNFGIGNFYPPYGGMYG